ncbi:hypothetical protein WAI453_011973 [Rhynchosporium graminicola]
MIEPRIKAGVLIVAPGCDPGGLTQSPMAVKLAPFFADSSFTEMTTPALVVHGDADIPDHLTTKGLYGWDARECDDESVERCAVVQRMTWAYLRIQLDGEDRTWEVARKALVDLKDIGMVERMGEPESFAQTELCEKLSWGSRYVRDPHGKLIKRIPRGGETVDLKELFFTLTMDSATELYFWDELGYSWGGVGWRDSNWELGDGFSRRWVRLPKLCRGYIDEYIRKAVELRKAGFTAEKVE